MNVRMNVVAERRQFFITATKSTVARGAQMSRSRFAILLVFIALFCVLFAFCYHRVMDDAILEETSVTVLPLDDPTTTFTEYANETSKTSQTPTVQTVQTVPTVDHVEDVNATDIGDYHIVEDVGRAVHSFIDFTCEQLWEASSANGTRSTSLNISLPDLNDTRHRVSGIASMNLWRNLTLMEEVDDIFVEASTTEMILISSHSNESIRGQLLSTLVCRAESILDKVEALMMSNVALAPLYQEQKLEVETAISISTDAEPSEMELRSLHAATIRDLLVRRRLLCHLIVYDGRNVSDDAEFERAVLSEAVIRLSKGADGERMQRLFDEAVEITLQIIDSEPENSSYGDQVDAVLFPTLEEMLVKEFNFELNAIRNELADTYQPA